MAAQILDSCTNCKACESVCPTQSIFPGSGKFVIDADTCDEHALCVKVCPVDAIRITKKSQADKKAKTSSA